MAKKAKKETPLMKQYNAIKAKYPDALLLFRVGDFYETFGNDAIKASEILDIILTKRGAGSESETELAGFPHHSLNSYLPKLVKAGCRVAICDQLEDPKQTKTIVKRGVTELVTPGVALNDDILHSKQNNFLAAVHFTSKYLGVSFLDVSTGEFFIAQGNDEYIDKLLQNFKPSEVLVSKPKRLRFAEGFGNDYHTFYMEDWVFQDDYANETLLKHFKTKSLKGFGIDDLYEGIVASGAVLHYLGETQHHKLEHITSIQRLTQGDYVWMDRFTIKNLELYQSTIQNAVTLVDVIDKTISPMGGRLLKRWLALPLVDLDRINERHEVVAFLNEDQVLLSKFQHQLKQIGDIERLISKVATAKINPREVVQLKNALEAIVPIKTLARQSKNTSLKSLGEQIENCEELRERIKATLNEEAPVNILKGNTISSDFSSELKELRALSTSSKAYLDDMLEQELGLGGELRPVTGVLAAVMEARRKGRSGVVLPWENLPEARLIRGPELYGVRDVGEALAVLRGEGRPDRGARGPRPAAGRSIELDLADVQGQHQARRALEVAAAGGHNLLLEGPPGSGKTMLARRLPSILPLLGDEEALEAARVRSAIRLLDPETIHRPIFRAPHHSASPAGLVGGGSPLRPGELSLGHRGVVFLDEFPEFDRRALEALREPLEEGVIHLTRARELRSFPADFLCVAAMNPCPCGWAGLNDGRCRCAPRRVEAYRGRLSGPLLDRFDLRVFLRPVPAEALFETQRGESSEAVAARVRRARERQSVRFGGGVAAINARVDERRLREAAGYGSQERAFLLKLVSAHQLSARAIRRLERVARTIADLEGAESVRQIHLMEALGYRLGRSLEREDSPSR